MANVNKIRIGTQDYEIDPAVTYCTCNTAAGTAAKTASLTNFTLRTGSVVQVKFTYSNTAASPTLNINSTGAKAIKVYGSTAAGTSSATSWEEGAVVEFVYDGTNWVMSGNNYGYVPRNGGTFTGNVEIAASNAGTTQGWTTLSVGNNTAVGTVGNTRGQIRVYGTGERYVAIRSDPTTNREAILPDADGTLALKDNSFNSIGTLSGNTSRTITIPNSYRGIFCIFLGGSTGGMYMITSSSTGAVYVTDIKAAGNITYSTSTNSITFTNGSSGNRYMYAIGSALL